VVTVFVSVGVPEMAPVDELNAIPAGRLGVIDHVVAGDPALRGFTVGNEIFLYPV
jgi:hypothetical protein